MTLCKVLYKRPHERSILAILHPSQAASALDRDAILRALRMSVVLGAIARDELVWVLRAAMPSIPDKVRDRAWAAWAAESFDGLQRSSSITQRFRRATVSGSV